MAKAKQKHPIRRIRDALKITPEELNIREYATADGFAKLIGRSPSHLRNVECGSIDNWENLAELIERKTKVSSKWLLSKPKPEAPVLDVEGNPWKAERYLDRLAPKDKMPDWRFLLKRNPGVIPELIAQMIKAQIILEMSFGHENSIANMNSLFHRMETFHNPGLKDVLPRVMDVSSESMLNRAMNPKIGLDQKSAEDVAALYGIDFGNATLVQLEKLLDGEGYGWASKLQHLPDKGLLADARSFYARKYRKRQLGEADNEE